MKYFFTCIKCAISVLLLYAIVHFSGGVEQIYQKLASGNIKHILYGFLFIFASTLFAGYRWYIVMKTLKFKGSMSFYIKSYFTGVFFSQLLPSSIGGDAYRVLQIADLGYKKRDSFYGVLIDRGLGIVGIFIVGIISNNMFTGFLPNKLYVMLNIIFLLGIIGFIFFALLFKIRFLERFKLFSIILSISSSLYSVLNSWRKIIFQLSLSVIIHILTFIGVYFIAQGFNTELPLSIFCTIMPPILLSTIIPISLAGWGIRESGMIGFLKYASVTAETSASISIVFGLIYVALGIFGLFFWVINKSNKKVYL